MVTGAAELHRKFDKVPGLVRDELVKVLEEEAAKVVSEMRSLAPLPQIAAAINWTWGEDVPAGSIRIGSYRGSQYGKLAVTIYVDRDGAWYAHFWEFGTGPRYQKTTGRYTGQIMAQPYFYPVFRANKRRIKARLSRAVSRAMKKANKL